MADRMAQLHDEVELTLAAMHDAEIRGDEAAKIEYAKRGFEAAREMGYIIELRRHRRRIKRLTRRNRELNAEVARLEALLLGRTGGGAT